MIIDRIGNACKYFDMGKGIADGLRYLESTDFFQLQPGRYDIQGDDCYALVQQVTTKPSKQGIWEAHRRYIDIQYVVSGNERMGYANLEALTVSQEYDEAGDYVLMDGQGDFLTVIPGTFVIFMPQDAHMPCIAVSEPETVRKVVVKVRV